MSLTTKEASSPVRTAAATPEEIAAFKQLHESEVRTAIDVMLRKIRPGQRYRQVITPLRILVRDEFGSPHIREDFTTPGCQPSILMRALFRLACPDGIEMTFDYETREYWLPNEDDPSTRHKEPITQMVVYFFVVPQRSRPPRKKRNYT